MQHYDALIVGGGPAGATCAAALCRRGLDVVVLDKASFPRTKLCAGWITPELFQTLAVDPAEYGRGRVLQAMTAFRIGRIGGPHVVVSYGRPVSFGIRRSELDDFLLRRAGARSAPGRSGPGHRAPGRPLAGQRRDRDAPAGGRRGAFLPGGPLAGHGPAGARGRRGRRGIRDRIEPCGTGPLARRSAGPGNLLLRRPAGLRLVHSQGAAVERRPGREDGRALPGHVRGFCDFLKQQGPASRGRPSLPGTPTSCTTTRRGRCWPTACSGSATRPAWPPRKAAKASARRSSRACWRPARLPPPAATIAGSGWRRNARAMEARFGRRRCARRRRGRPRAWRRLLGRKLLAQRWFVRRVVLDRWFLHAGQTPLEPEAEV